jgi:uncharacterized cupin superfamily protein
VPATPIMISHTAVELKSSPINPDWIVEGNPVARNSELSRSRDGTACTLVWDCTPGKFVWHYNIDETIHILEGSIVLDDGSAPPRRLGVGDVVFFPAGAKVHWHVETHVRKLAFFRRQMPKPIEIMTRAARKAKMLVRPSRVAESGFMGAPQPVAMARVAGS